MADSIEDQVLTRKKHVPGSGCLAEEVFDFPFLIDPQTTEFVQNHGRIMFIIRGPPGTSKGELRALITKKFPSAVVCCADLYFSLSFQSNKHDKSTVCKSHLFCQKKARQACESGEHPIIIENSHIRRWEVDDYLHFARDYNYTVVMAITLRKFDVTAKVLEATNHKQLSSSFLGIRIKAWQEYIPVYLGWFLGPEDQSFVLQQVKLALQSLLDEEKFCEVFNFTDKDELWDSFNAEKGLFCVAAFLNHGRNFEISKFYLKDKIQAAYSKCYTFSIMGFVVNPKVVYAVAVLGDDMKKLMSPSTKYDRESDEIGSLCTRLNTLGLETQRQEPKSLKGDFSSSGKTARLEDVVEEMFNTNDIGFIRAARSADELCTVTDTKRLAKKLFSRLTDDQGFIDDSVFCKFADGTRHVRLDDESWFVARPQKIVVSGIFTGQYI